MIFPNQSGAAVIIVFTITLFFSKLCLDLRIAYNSNINSKKRHDKEITKSMILDSIERRRRILVADGN